jgi:hypothetical protein
MRAQSLVTQTNKQRTQPSTRLALARTIHGGSWIFPAVGDVCLFADFCLFACLFDFIVCVFFLSQPASLYSGTQPEPAACAAPSTNLLHRY